MERKIFNSRLGELKTQFRALAENGYNGFEIVEKLGVSNRQADKLHTSLLKAGQISPLLKLEFTAVGMPEVAAKGNIFITQARLKKLGLSDVFGPNVRLQYIRSGDDLIIKALSRNGTPKSIASEKQKAPQKQMRKHSLWRRLLGSNVLSKISRVRED